jgi:predicted acetyltransferase
MRVQTKEAAPEDKYILERLMQLYLYDFSAIEGFDVGRDGLFETTSLDSYWRESGRYPFLICADNQVAGLLLVNSHTCIEENSGAKSIAEFFVMRGYRRRGVGRFAARQTFDKFPGKWEVRQMTRNAAGQSFWRTVIGEYTQGRFTEVTLDDDKWKGPIQSFDNG